MTSASDSPLPCRSALQEPSSPSTKAPLIGFYVVTVLFNLCLTAQVLTVGLAAFQDASWWSVHTWLVRGYAGLSLVLLVWVYWLSVSTRIRTLTFSLPILMGLQFLTIYLPTSLPISLAVIHPLIGFSLFAASTTLVHRVGHLVFPHQRDRETTAI